MTDPRRWTTVVIPGTPPVEVVEASAYDEARAERLRLSGDLATAEFQRDRYREALERIAARVEDDDGCPPSIEQIARAALNETQEQRFGARDDRPELCGGSRWLAGPEIDCPGCPDCQDGTQEQER